MSDLRSSPSGPAFGFAYATFNSLNVPDVPDGQTVQVDVDYSGGQQGQVAQVLQNLSFAAGAAAYNWILTSVDRDGAEGNTLFSGGGFGGTPNATTFGTSGLIPRNTQTLRLKITNQGGADLTGAQGALQLQYLGRLVNT